MLNVDYCNLSTADRILYAAMQIISEVGLEGLSASKLADTVKISKSSIFHYYKKMDEIPALILKKLYTEIINPIQEGEYENAHTYLKTLGYASFSLQPDHIVIYKAFLSLFQASMYDTRLKEIVMACSEEFDASLYSKLRQLCKVHVEDITIKKFSRLLSMSLDGIVLHYLIHSQTKQAQEAWDVLIDTIVKQFHLE